MAYLNVFINNRPLKLNNFLFSAMSGVGGYTLNAKSYHTKSNSIVGTFGDYSIEVTAKVTDILGIVWTENGVWNMGLFRPSTQEEVLTEQ